MNKKLNIEGMSCMHCVGSVTKAIEESGGVSDVVVSLEEKEANFSYDETKIEIETIIKNIKEVGFTATE